MLHDSCSTQLKTIRCKEEQNTLEEPQKSFYLVKIILFKIYSVTFFALCLAVQHTLSRILYIVDFNLSFLFLKKIFVLVLQIFEKLRCASVFKPLLKVFKVKRSPFLFPCTFLQGKSHFSWLLLKTLYSIKDLNLFSVSRFKQFLRLYSFSFHDESCYSVPYLQWIL